jgi:glutaminase
MINSGAIVTTDLIKGRDYAERLGRLIGMFSRYAGRELHVDNAVFKSERATGNRNRAIAYLMSSFGMLGENIEETLELYFQQCALLLTCRDLAIMGATLASGGINPLSGERAIEQEYVKDILSIMLSCGMYDYSGEWAYRIGIPAKSGVGGGIVAVVPGRGAIATFAPPLDAKGNSVRGIKVFEELSHLYSLHYLEAVFRGNTLGRILKGSSAT